LWSNSVLLYIYSAGGKVGGYCDQLFGLLGTQLGQLCLLAVLTHPLTPPPSPLICGTRVIASCVQNISQNQQPVAIDVRVMIAIALLYSWCESYVASIKHKEATV